MKYINPIFSSTLTNSNKQNHFGRNHVNNRENYLKNKRQRIRETKGINFK